MTLPHKNLLITIVDSFIDSLAFCILSSAYVVNFILQKKLIHSLGLHPKLHLCSEIYYIKGEKISGLFWPFFCKLLIHSRPLKSYGDTLTPLDPHSSLLPHQHGVLLIFLPMHAWHIVHGHDTFRFISMTPNYFITLHLTPLKQTLVDYVLHKQCLNFQKLNGSKNNF